MGEGDPLSPEDQEYRDLAQIPAEKRTEDQTARLWTLANIIMEQSADYWKRKYLRLKDEVGIK